MPTRADWKPTGGLRRRLFEIVFESDTRAGRAFDVILIGVILASVLTVIVESVEPIRVRHGTTLYVLEWVFTLVFTVEYLLRLYCVGRPLRYAVSFYGVIDLAAIVPTYVSLLFPGAQ